MKKSNLISLIVINLIPIVGVVFWKWNIYDLLSLYWLETVILGFFNFLKLFFIRYDSPHESWASIIWWFLIFIFLLYATSFFLFLDKNISFSEKISQLLHQGFAGITLAGILIVIFELFVFAKCIILKEFEVTSYRKLYITPLLRVLFLFVGPSLIALFTVIFINSAVNKAISFQLAVGFMILIKVVIESLFATRGYYD